MIQITLVYHVCMMVAVFFLLNRFRRKTTAISFLHYAIFGAAAAMALAFVVGDTNCRFLVPLDDGWTLLRSLDSDLRLFAQGLFIEGTLFAFGAGAIALRSTGTSKSSRKFGLFAIALAALMTVVGIDACWFEPYHPTVRHLTIESEKITRPIRVLFASDLQSDRFGERERKAFNLIKAQKADLIIFGGDYVQYSRLSVDENDRAEGRKFRSARNLGDDLHRFLTEQALSAPLGVYAIGGTWREDKFGPKWFRETGIRFIDQTSNLPISDELTLSVLCGADTRRPPTSAFPFIEQRKNDKTFRILVGHVPSYAFFYPTADLLLAGHTHGGQVRLPFWGAIFTMTNHYSRRYASGHFLWSDAAGRPNHFIVSNGLGMERLSAPQVRLFCRPDFWVIDLRPKPQRPF